MELVLASRSPRRAALLAEAGIAFVQGPYPDVDEQPPRGVAAPEVARLLAERKVRAVLRHLPDSTVLAADTVVALDEELLGKPRDRADARRMLARLSGRTHVVATGVAVGRGGVVESGVDVSRVTFRVLEAGEIEAYVRSGEPLDKAGAYGIQGGAAGFVARREGRLDTVVGLSLPLVRTLLVRLAGGSAEAAEASGR